MDEAGFSHYGKGKALDKGEDEGSVGLRHKSSLTLIRCAVGCGSKSRGLRPPLFGGLEILIVGGSRPTLH